MSDADEQQETKDEDKDKASSDSAPNVLTWFLGIGNFLLVTALGTYFSFKTQELENKISTIQTAAQFIEIVADQDAPGYAKSLALNSIFHEKLLSRDLVLDAAYRIEDETLEKTVVGPLLYQVAEDTELLALPFGSFDFVRVQGKEEGAVDITMNGWALDDQGWSSDRTAGDQRGLPLFQVHLDGALRCEYPYRKSLDCTVSMGPRPDIDLIYSQYPDALMSGFRVIFTEKAAFNAPKLLSMRLIDPSGRDRVVYSRCIDMGQSINGHLAVETPFNAGGCG